MQTIITHTATRIPSRPDQLMHEKGMRHWRITLMAKDESGKTVSRMTTYYSQGNAHTEAPTLADVLACLYSDSCAPESFDAFCAEYGYDADSMSAHKTWKACRSIAIRIRKLIGPHGVWLLRDGEAVAAGHPNMLVGWMHRHHSFSWSHALAHEGYTTEPVR